MSEGSRDEEPVYRHLERFGVDFEGGEDVEEFVGIFGCVWGWGVGEVGGEEFLDEGEGTCMCRVVSCRVRMKVKVKG